MSIENRVAIVTGAESGIGREIAITLGSLGANVVVNYLNNYHERALRVNYLDTLKSS